MGAKKLNLNTTKISDIEEHIKEFNERKRKLIEKNKITVYDIISELYGLENQELIDAVTAEHQLIKNFTANGMTFDDISEMTANSKNEKFGQSSFFQTADTDKF